MNLKESQEYMGGFGERKRKGEVILLYYNVKNKRYNKKQNQAEIQGQDCPRDAKGSNSVRNKSHPE